MTRSANEGPRRAVAPTALGATLPGAGESNAVKPATSLASPASLGTPGNTAPPLGHTTTGPQPNGAGSISTPPSPIGAVPGNATPSGSTASALATTPSGTSLNVNGLAGSISGALLDANGTYAVTIAMHPNELGHVQAVMSLNGTELHVALSAQNATGHHALASALDDLKNELGRGGMNVNVSLRDSSSDQRDERRAQPRDSNSDVVATDNVAPLSTAPRPSTSHINLIL
ncbi:MAG TPA: flagellar hook-length control protein FliK [Acidimicrobiales bacterium]|nr:flagellar hook-length control protein FliK [Acidimicrobiales bacterium]